MIKKRNKKLKKICPCCGAPKKFKPFDYHLELYCDPVTQILNYEAVPIKKGLTPLLGCKPIKVCVSELLSDAAQYAETAKKTDDLIKGYMKNFCLDVTKAIIDNYPGYVKKEHIEELNLYRNSHIKNSTKHLN